MLTNLKELAMAIRRFAHHNDDRPKRLNVLLPEADLLDTKAYHFSFLIKEDIEVVIMLKKMNAILDQFGKTPRTGTLAEDTHSLNDILLAANNVAKETTKAQKTETRPDVRKELRHLKVQIAAIIKFLKRRRQDIYDLKNFRIGGH